MTDTPPLKWTEEMRTYLNQLRESGITNMFGATPYLQSKFHLSRGFAADCLVYWMQTFGDKDENN